MSKVKITTDSTCDLTQELIRKHNIDIIPLYVNLDGIYYKDGVDIKLSKIFEHVDGGGNMPKTAAPAPTDYEDTFKKYINDGYEIVHFSIGSSLSASYQVAMLSASEFDGVYIVDTKSLSTGVGQMALLAAKMAESGKSAKEIYEWFTKNIDKFYVIFLIDMLDYLYKGGRCSMLQMLGANLLKIKPSIVVTKEGGKLTVGKKYRGKIIRCYEEMVEDELSGKLDKLNTDYVFITHTPCVEGAAEAIREKLRSLADFKEIYETDAGCVIGSHCGPGTLGIIYSEKE